MIGMGMRCKAVTMFKKGRKEEERKGEGRRKKEKRGREKKKKNAHDKFLTETIDDINPLKNGRR